MLSHIRICQTFNLKILSINGGPLHQGILDILNCIINVIIFVIQIIKYFLVNMPILLHIAQILISNKTIHLIILSFNLIIKNFDLRIFHKYHIYHTIFI